MTAVCLDSSFLFDLIAEDPHVLESVADLDGPVVVSAVSLYELLAGETSRRRIAQVEALARDFPVVDAGYEVCALAASIQTRLLALGRPIPKFDTIVAATAILAEATLVARDRHFEWIPSEFGLRVRRYGRQN